MSGLVEQEAQQTPRMQEQAAIEAFGEPTGAAGIPVEQHGHQSMDGCSRWFTWAVWNTSKLQLVQPLLLNDPSRSPLSPESADGERLDANS